MANTDYSTVRKHQPHHPQFSDVRKSRMLRCFIPLFLRCFQLPKVVSLTTIPQTYMLWEFSVVFLWLRYNRLSLQSLQQPPVYRRHSNIPYAHKVKWHYVDMHTYCHDLCEWRIWLYGMNITVRIVFESFGRCLKRQSLHHITFQWCKCYTTLCTNISNLHYQMRWVTDFAMCWSPQ